MLQKYKSVVLYLVFGICTTVMNFSVYYICTRWLQLSVITANVVSWIVSVWFAYRTNAAYVFGKNRSFQSLLQFYAARLGTGLFDVVGLYVLTHFLFTNDMITKLVLNVVVIILNYIISKYCIFGKMRSKDERCKTDSSGDGTNH